VDVSIRPGWFYHENESPKSVEELMEIYYNSVGHNANLLLNFPVNKEGRIPSVDSLRAVEWHRLVQEQYADDLLKAAEKGNEESQIELGNLFYGIAEQMEGKTENDAAEHLESAKEILAKGKTAKYLYGQAAYWYENAANQTPDDTSCLKLGKMFYEGKGLKWHQKLFGRNYRLSLKWYSKAAELDSADALLAAGKMYYEGKGVRQNYYKAMQWLRRAAHKNNAEAQYLLGLMYENAMGVYKNNEEAKNWYSKAAAQGHKEAQAALERLGKR
ncbi:MAG: SEL1-like repeat protein, partial [Elusimicrobiales bacterium]|nr:SEL1-like repeat protein [Elusimicrobiales bacterium]